jgi:hypothetical protein
MIIRTFQGDLVAKSWLQQQLYKLHVLKQTFLFSWIITGKDNLRKLSNLKNSQAGKRCFIIGNGPSLRQTDLTLLQNEYTFGLNRIYLLFPELGFSTSYIVTINLLVIQQCLPEILAQPGLKFLPWILRKNYPDPIPPNVVLIHTEKFKPGFQPNACHPLWQGATVTFVAMQLAYHMGFEKVILVGVDHSFTTPGVPNATVVSQGDDPNHFSSNYFGKGFKWQLPDLVTSETAYQMARQAYEADGREIVDATIGGKLTVFPKIEYQTLFR